MNAIIRSLAGLNLAGLAALVLADPSFAQTYPNKPIKMIVTFAPGGPTDVIGRVVAQKVGEAWGQQVVVENVAGGGGNIGVAAAMRSPPDGYTIVVVSTGYIINPSLYAKVPYEFKDFTPISLVATSPDSLTVNPAVPARTVQELVALVKANPGKYSYAQPGIGSTPHLAGELFKLRFGLDLTMVPFTSAAPAITSTIGGHTPVAFSALPPALANIQEGKLRGLAVLSSKRNAGVPDMPTMAESGVPGFETTSWHGMVVPARTPKAISARLHTEMVKMLNQPDVKALFLSQGMETVGSSPEQFAAYIKHETEKWTKVIKMIGLKPQ